MDKYIIVTGANGYLGYYVCNRLLDEGYLVIGLTYTHFASRLIENAGISYFEYDLTKKIDQNQNLNTYLKQKNIIAVLNLAALLGSSNYDKNYQVNAEGVNNIMHLAQSIGVHRIIQISSVVVLKKIKGPYGVTKLEGQEFLTASNFDFTVFIPAMILGPEGLGLNRVLKNVFRLPLFVPIIGTGKQTQHPIFVKDFAKYIVKSIELPQTYQKVYEIAGGSVISFRDFVSLILKIKKRKKILVSIPVFVASWLGWFFQKTQKVPLFTAEHVKGVLQNSNLNTEALRIDLDFTPTPFSEALEYSLNIIEDNWNYYLQSRDEQYIKR